MYLRGNIELREEISLRELRHEFGYSSSIASKVIKTDFFEDLAQEDTHGRLAYFFATHPYPQDRIQTLREYMQQRKYSSGGKLPLDESLEDLAHTPESGSDTLKKILEH